MIEVPKESKPSCFFLKSESCAVPVRHSLLHWVDIYEVKCNISIILDNRVSSFLIYLGK